MMPELLRNPIAITATLVNHKNLRQARKQGEESSKLLVLEVMACNGGKPPTPEDIRFTIETINGNSTVTMTWYPHPKRGVSMVGGPLDGSLFNVQQDTVPDEIVVAMVHRDDYPEKFDEESRELTTREEIEANTEILEAAGVVYELAGIDAAAERWVYVANSSLLFSDLN